MTEKESASENSELIIVGGSDEVSESAEATVPDEDTPPPLQDINLRHLAVPTNFNVQ